MPQRDQYHGIQDDYEREPKGLTIVDDAHGVRLQVLLRHGNLQSPFSAAMLFLRFARIAP